MPNPKRTTSSKRTAAATERTFYPALLDIIREKGGSGVQEVLYNSYPDIQFDYLGSTWLLSVKLGESLGLVKSAFLQYLRHKEESGIDRGILLLLPDSVKTAKATAEGVRAALLSTRVTVLIDALTVKEELRDRTFSEVLELLRLEIAQRVEQGISTHYPLTLVIGLLREQVTDLMRGFSATQREILKVVTSFDLLRSLGRLKPADASEGAKFLAAYIVLSQTLFLRLFASVHPEVAANIQPVNRTSLRRAFGRVLHINYKPIFEWDVLDAVPDTYIKDTFDLIWGIEVEKVRYELPGRIFHELMPPDIRKMLAAFYTRPQAAELLADLCISASEQTVFDPACGSGTILTAAYRAKKLRHDDSELTDNPHRRYCEDDIFGADIMPFAQHLTCANLAAMDVATTIEKTQILNADSISIVPGRSYRGGIQQYGLFRRQASARTASGEEYPVTIEHGSIDVVMMNPPFTKVERGIRNFVNMERFRPSAGGEVGLWGHFVFLADIFLRDGGIYGAVLPINILRGRESMAVRRFMFSRWSPLYILKCTRNYGFSEWAEYRDILFIANKNACSNTHEVKFCLVKKDLRKLTESDIQHIHQELENTARLRSAELDIDTHPVSDLTSRFDNLMWYCGGSDLGHRDTILNFLELFREKLSRFPNDYLSTGFRPDGGISDFLFLTRASRPERVEEAFLRFSRENREVLFAESPLGATFRIDRSSLTPSLRTPVGVDRMDLSREWDYAAHRSYNDFRRVKRACGFKGISDWRTFWNATSRSLERARTHISVVRRINPFSPSMSLVSFFSEELISPSDQLNIIAETNLESAKAICAVLNSSVFFAQFMLLKEESTGRYIDVRVYDLEEMDLYPQPEHIQDLARVFDNFSAVRFPSLRHQFDSNFDARYEEFWDKERSPAFQNRLWSALERPVQPSTSRLDLDRGVCTALGVAVSDEQLHQLYEIFVKEMILTRGLMKD